MPFEFDSEGTTEFSSVEECLEYAYISAEADGSFGDSIVHIGEGINSSSSAGSTFFPYDIKNTNAYKYKFEVKASYKNKWHEHFSDYITSVLPIMEMLVDELQWPNSRSNI